MTITNFKFSEFTKTGTGLDNSPDSFETVLNICRLAEQMQQLRTALGLPVVITSGYRSPDVNRAVGGVARSLHLQGKACDFYVLDRRRDIANRKALDYIKAFIPYDELGVYLSKDGAIERFHFAPYIPSADGNDAPKNSFYVREAQ